jgi:hypothetical protein
MVRENLDFLLGYLRLWALLIQRFYYRKYFLIIDLVIIFSWVCRFREISNRILLSIWVLLKENPSNNPVRNIGFNYKLILGLIILQYRGII